MSTRWLSIIATRERIELSTECVCPPIPFRGWDWSAIDSNTYDVGDIDGEDGLYTTSPQGQGETEMEAINDLLDQLEESRPDRPEPDYTGDDFYICDCGRREQRGEVCCYSHAKEMHHATA